MSKPAVFEVAIDEIRPDPNNARRHPERNLSALAASFKRFGQQKPVVVDQDGVIIAGSGWWMAMKAAGAKKIIVSRSALTGPERTAYAIADNRTAELSEWDAEILEQQLDVLGDEFKDAMLFDEIALGGEKSAKTDKLVNSQMGGLQFRVLIECDDEKSQTTLIERFTEEGLRCRALIS